MARLRSVVVSLPPGHGTESAGPARVERGVAGIRAVHSRASLSDGTAPDSSRETVRRTDHRPIRASPPAPGLVRTTGSSRCTPGSGVGTPTTVRAVRRRPRRPAGAAGDTGDVQLPVELVDEHRHWSGPGRPRRSVSPFPARPTSSRRTISRRARAGARSSRAPPRLPVPDGVARPGRDRESRPGRRRPLVATDPHVEPTGPYLEALRLVRVDVVEPADGEAARFEVVLEQQAVVGPLAELDALACDGVLDGADHTVSLPPSGTSELAGSTSCTSGSPPRTLAVQPWRLATATLSARRIVFTVPVARLTRKTVLSPERPAAHPHRRARWPRSRRLSTVPSSVSTGTDPTPNWLPDSGHVRRRSSIQLTRSRRLDRPGRAAREGPAGSSFG